MVVGAEAVSQLIGQLYGAAADPARWEVFLESMMHAMGGTASSIIVHGDEQAGVGRHTVSKGIRDEYARAYEEYYSSKNIVLEASLAIDPLNYIGTLQSCIDLGVYRRSEIYNDYARPQNLYYQCCALLSRNGGSAAAISFMRPERDGTFGEDHVQLLTLLAPHMRQAFHIHGTLRRHERSEAGLEAALDQSETAMFLLDGTGRLQRANARGHQMLVEGSGLVARNGQLQPSVPQNGREFDELVSATCATGAGRRQFPGGFLLLHRLEGRPLHCRLTPFYSDNSFLEASPCALLLVGDPDRRPSSRSDVLRALYRLTPSEGQLADLLLAGETVSTAAEKRRITEESARTQLKSILHKTDTNRQSDLIRLLLSIPV